LPDSRAPEILKVHLENGTEPLRVLCLGSHADDLEIGCGGTMLSLIASRPVVVNWVVFGATGARAEEARSAAGDFLGAAAESSVRIESFRDGFFPSQNAEIKEVFEDLKTFRPDIVFTHYREDRHQDHRVLSDLAWSTFRHHLIVEYEVPKYDGDLGIPNFFVPLDPAICRRKVDTILTRFGTQRDRHWFREDTFFALLRLRGIEAASPTGYAEAFYSRKVVVGFE
jgi:LmbE family N-acetylglucosaminyl deacetylase